MWDTTLKPQSLARENEWHTAPTVWPRLVSRATSSYTLWTPISMRVHWGAPG